MDPNMSGGAEGGNVTDGSYLNAAYTIPEQLESVGAAGDELREQDRFLPIANVARIMKKAIPNNGKISKEAKECCQECVSEFISFITSEASDRCSQEKRKTINGEDILYAMSTLGFDNYVEPLKLYLQKYRESNKDRGISGEIPEGMATSNPMFSDGSQSIIIGTDGSSQSGGVLYNNYQATYISEAD